jgi:hypothetical protein
VQRERARVCSKQRLNRICRDLFRQTGTNLLGGVLAEGLTGFSRDDGDHSENVLTQPGVAGDFYLA